MRSRKINAQVPKKTSLKADLIERKDGELDT